LEPVAAPLEDLLDQAVTATAVATLWLPHQTLTAARLVSWCRASGVLVCRGGNGFTDDDVHFLRAASIQGISLRIPAPRTEKDRIGPAMREALRQAAGYPLSLAVRPDAFPGADDALALWLKAIIEAVASLDPLREPLQKEVDQILLREGASTAILGGSTLILEATPAAIPAATDLRAAIAALLV
jgi:hypothetical protein